MAHRGRLNVLAHVLGKPYDMILSDFEGVAHARHRPRRGHHGGLDGRREVPPRRAPGRIAPSDGAVSVLVTLAPNPSHLEFVDPVVRGWPAPPTTTAT